MPQGQKDPYSAQRPGTLKAKQTHLCTVSFEDLNWKSKPSFGGSNTFGTGYLYMAISVIGVDKTQVLQFSSASAPSGTHHHHTDLCILYGVCWGRMAGGVREEQMDRKAILVFLSNTSAHFLKDPVLNS